MRDDIDDDDFYEEDEPIEKILAILERPPDAWLVPRSLPAIPVAPGVWQIVGNDVADVA